MRTHFQGWIKQVISSLLWPRREASFPPNCRFSQEKASPPPVYSILSPELMEQRMCRAGAKGERREFAHVNIMLAAKCHPPLCLEAQ